jgi:hypothetical protein
VDNNYLDLGMNKSGFVHTLPSGRLTVNRISAAAPDALTVSLNCLACGCRPHGRTGAHTVRFSEWRVETR